jgi:hypothetical protein
MGLFGRAKDVAKQAGGGLSYGLTTSPGKQMAARDSIQGQAQHFKALREGGVDGTAVIIEIVDTGEVLAGNPVQDFHMDLTLAGDAMERVVHREIVSSAAVGKYPIGEPRKVKVNPDDHADLTFAW